MMKFRRLRANEVECRIGSCSKEGSSTTWCDLLLYKDARADMKILDETVGAMNWKREHKMIDGNLYCVVSIYDEEHGQWVSKEDVGTESNTEKEKGQASDSFKRACVNWGPGRELYTAPHIRIFGGGRNTQARVTELDYDEAGNITTLTIVGRANGYADKTDSVLFQMVNGAIQRVQKSGTQPKAVTPPPAASQLTPILTEVRERAASCKSLNELKEYQTILIAAAMWNDNVKNYFNDLAKANKWI